MAQKSNDKRIARREKSERNMNRAVILLIAGLVAEWYLLMADRYYVHGPIATMLVWSDFLWAMIWVGLGLFAAGAVLLLLRAKKRWFRPVGCVLLGVGAFFALSSAVMRYGYPLGVTVMCVFVPVLLLLGIICLFYQAEFAIQAAALAMALGALVLLNRSGSVRVRACAVLAILGTAALCVFSLALEKNRGMFGKGDRRVRIIGKNADYRLLFGVLALCLVAVLAALFAPVIAFYGTWVLGIIAFVLAVYYTIKLM